MAEKDEHSEVNERIEWIVAGISTLIVLVLSGFILFEAVTKTGGIPDISFAISRSATMGTAYVIEVEVRNDGHVTVAGVDIEAEAALSEGQIETSTVTLDYLPAESSTEVGLVFSQQVDPEQVTLRVLGYRYP